MSDDVILLVRKMGVPVARAHSEEELAAVEGIGPSLAARIRSYFEEL